MEPDQPKVSTQSIFSNTEAWPSFSKENSSQTKSAHIIIILHGKPYPYQACKCFQVTTNDFLLYTASFIYQQISSTNKDIKVSVKTVWHCCDLEIWSRSMKVVWTSIVQQVVISCKVWQLTHLLCLRKSQRKSCCHAGESPGRPNTGSYTDSNFHVGPKQAGEGDGGYCLNEWIAVNISEPLQKYANYKLSSLWNTHRRIHVVLFGGRMT